MQSEGLTSQIDERKLSDQQFAIIERIAAAQIPALPKPTESDLYEIIASLSAVLITRSHDNITGRLKLRIYADGLADLSLPALQHAAREARLTMKYMPAPAELRELASHYRCPEREARDTARLIARKRLQRLFNARRKSIDDGNISDSDIANLSPADIEYGVQARQLLIETNGTVIRWTKRDYDRITAEREASFATWKAGLTNG